MGKRKDDNPVKPQVDPELEGFDLTIDSFGEIKSSFDIKKINQFLDRKVEDKKLRNRIDPGSKDSVEDNPPDSDWTDMGSFE